MSMPLTVANLRALLEGAPDNAVVTLAEEDHGSMVQRPLINAFAPGTDDLEYMGLSGTPGTVFVVEFGEEVAQ